MQSGIHAGQGGDRSEAKSKHAGRERPLHLRQHLKRFLRQAKGRRVSRARLDEKKKAAYAPLDDLGMSSDLVRREAEHLEPFEAGSSTERDVALSCGASVVNLLRRWRVRKTHPSRRLCRGQP